MTDLCRPFLNALPVRGASIAVLADPFGKETICASDRLAARLDELQIDLGLGPCWDALSTRTPVFTSDIRRVDHRWPVLADAIGDERIGALFALPLYIGSLDIGAVDLYTEEPGTLTESEAKDAVALSTAAARQVLLRALDAAQPGATYDTEPGTHSRRLVHQATGMVIAQLGISATDALLVLRARAYADGRSVREVADDIVDRRLDLSSGADEI
ncbi:hypothetical protein ASC59_03640 [Leifsonia sp. Root1293]|nr:hypothetical protein ASC59_03640 [Leifsonia sp. Root1293]KRA12692.1 hypothetical protein ASD61_03640 [Leifsonia sp. Root60]